MISWLTSNFGVGVASSLVGAAMLYVGQLAYRRARRHPVRLFWAAFAEETVIMTTEYTVESEESGPWRPDPTDDVVFENDDQLLATRTTSGYFLSYGMAIALSNLRTFLQRELRSTVTVMGDKGHSRPREGRNLIVLGSPANNRYLKTFVREMEPSHPLLKRFVWTVGDNGVSLTLPSGETLTPAVDADEDGVDFALVSYISLSRGRKTAIVIVSGCNMWGTEAATQYLLDRDMMKALPRRVRRSPEGLAFVIKAWISHGSADHVELYPAPDGTVFFDLRQARPE